MKRLAIIIVVCVFALMNCAFASEANDTTHKRTKSEILFRDVPWGSSVQETLHMLKKGSGSVTVHNHYLTSIESTTVIRYQILIPNLKVCGFPAMDRDGYNIILYFLPELSADKTTYSDSEGKLICAEYVCIGPTDDLSMEEVEKELINKLVITYGDIRINNQWRMNNAVLSLTTATHKEKYETVAWKEWHMSKLCGGSPGPEPQKYYDEPYTVTDGYNLSYSDYWYEKYKTEIAKNEHIIQQQKQRKQEIEEQERLEKERQEQEQKERDVENRGFDGL